MTAHKGKRLGRSLRKSSPSSPILLTAGRDRCHSLHSGNQEILPRNQRNLHCNTMLPPERNVTKNKSAELCRNPVLGLPPDSGLQLLLHLCLLWLLKIWRGQRNMLRAKYSFLLSCSAPFMYRIQRDKRRETKKVMGNFTLHFVLTKHLSPVFKIF